MKGFIGLSLVLVAICVAGQNYLRDGVMIGSDKTCPAATPDRVFTVVDSFNPGFWGTWGTWGQISTFYIELVSRRDK